jgi:arylsulfatase A-like enzyme
LEDHYTIKLRHAGFYPVTISPFVERHAAFWFYNGFREMYNTGKGGVESAEDIMPTVIDWLTRRGQEDSWYLHINLWDPHTPYRAPADFGNPFEDIPAPDWMTEDIRRKTWDNYGPGCAQEPGGVYLGDEPYSEYADRMPNSIDSMQAYKKWIDGYDCGIRYADEQVGIIVNKLSELGILDDTMIIISSDHGENQGELSVYGDHPTADHITNRVPLIIRHPDGTGGRGRVDTALHYQFDITATLIDMLGTDVPESWDAESFKPAFIAEQESGRDFLVVGNCAWSCQRAVRWGDYIFIRTYHSGFKNYPEYMLFNVKEDPHELNNLADDRPDLTAYALAKLEQWTTDEMRLSLRGEDPLWVVMREGGPLHANFSSREFDEYIKRLENTGRSEFADELRARKARLAIKKL